MAIIAPQTTTFFGKDIHMGLSNRTNLQPQVEVVEYMLDLGQFYGSKWDQFTSNCKCPDQIPDPNNAGARIYHQPFFCPNPLSSSP